LISAMLTDRGKISTRWGEVETLPKPFDSVGFAEALYVALSSLSPPKL